ncbi:MAG: hypothetical protein GY803_29115 [Chloroflexi bacterium]|nr:hypothetical protein [Chloroflexota bacterium]
MNIQRMNELIELKQGVEDEFLGRPGVTGVDVGYKIKDGEKTDELAVRVYVAQKKGVRSVPKEERIPRKVNDAPTDVIERTFELHPARMALAEMTPMVDTGRYSPLKGGISIGPCRAVGGFIYVGTLGCMVTDNETDDPMMLTNFHVACVDENWSVGDTMAQPSRVDGGVCPADIVGQLQRAQVNAAVDAAVIRYDDESRRDHICEIEEIEAVNGAEEAVVGMAVRKRGRTTGLTYGVVDSVSLTVPIDYGHGIGVVTLRNQIGIEVDLAQSSMFGTNGDSGSVVVDDNNNVVGLYFAGSSDGTYGVANHIEAVLDAMNVSICAPPDIIPPKSILKDFFDNKNKDFIKEIKEKEWKEWKEKEKEKDLKDWKEKEKDWKEKDKDIYEGPGGDLPIDPRQPFAAQAQSAPPPAGDLEQRLARLEAALAQLTHFISPELRPDLSKGAFKRESDR